MLNPNYRIVSNKRPGGVAIFQKGDVYKRQVFNAKMQCLSLFTMTHRREIQAIYLVLFENKLGGRLLEGERLLETIRYLKQTFQTLVFFSEKISTFYWQSLGVNVSNFITCSYRQGNAQFRHLISTIIFFFKPIISIQYLQASTVSFSFSTHLLVAKKKGCPYSYREKYLIFYNKFRVSCLPCLISCTFWSLIIRVPLPPFLRKN